MATSPLETTPLTQEQLAAQGGAAEAFAEAAAILARLRAPDGCPWDLQQTMDSLQPHTLEEVYEVFDAIERRAWPELRDELGDLLLQVLFYAQIARDEGRFGIEDVVRGLSAKLLRRHPHVFGDAVARTPEAVNATWERVKREERAGGPVLDAGLLEDISRAMPAFVEARKLGARAAQIGFDWTEAGGLFDKVQEEVAELRAEVDAESRSAALVEEEFGDLLFVMTNLARHLRVDPEQALRGANAKFRRRFGAMERTAGGSDVLRGLATEQMEELWRQVKQKEKQA